MLNIRIAKDELTKNLLPAGVEELYINLTNELINYAKLHNKKSLNNKKIEEILLKQTSVTITPVSNVFMENLKVAEALTVTNDGVLNKKLDESLNRMLEILKKLKEGKGIHEIESHDINVQRSYTDEELVLIDAYVNLRKNAYKVIEYIGCFIIKKEVPKDKLDKDMFSLAIDALKMFDLDHILKFNKDLSYITKLMNVLNKFFNGKEIDMNTLREVKEPLEDSIYAKIIEKLNETSIRTISPISK